MKVGDKELEKVTEFEYLGSLLSWAIIVEKRSEEEWPKFWALWQGSRRFGRVKISV